jgi:hypothetical protein
MDDERLLFLVSPFSSYRLLLSWHRPASSHLPSAGPAGRDPRTILQQDAVVVCATPGTYDM